MRLAFTKMHGAGNDFVLIDNRDARFGLDELVRLTPQLCDRRLGIGADGLLALFPDDVHTYRMVYRNADGSDAGMCGNGGRCIAAYAIRSGVPDPHTFICHRHVYQAASAGTGIRLRFDMAVRIRPTDDGFRIDTGTDHLVVPVDAGRLEDGDWLRSTGRTLRHRHNANVNFVVWDGDAVRIRTYERGVEDLTLACGTGALAAATWAGDAGRDVPVISEGGTLTARFNRDASTGDYRDHTLTGPAVFVYEGAIEI